MLTLTFEQSPRPPEAIPRPLTPLSYLSSPVPDLASTLHTSAADGADEANVSFLRAGQDSLDALEQSSSQRDGNGQLSASGSGASIRRPSRAHVEALRDWRRSAPRTDSQHAASQTTPTDTLDDLSRRERLQRVLARLNRVHDPSASSSSAAGAYGDRTPSPSRQSLYDWAPSQEESSATNTARADDELDNILAELRRQQPETHPDILRVLGQSRRDSSRQSEGESQAPASTEAPTTDSAERRDRLRERRRRESAWFFSERSRAEVQRAIQRASPSATERMLRYVMDRERSGMSEEEERARGTGWFSPAAGSGRSTTDQHWTDATERDSWPLPSPLPPSTSDLRSRTAQERADAMQRRYMAEAGAPRLPRMSTPPVPATRNTPGNSQFLENALKYLNQLRECYTYEQALSAAIDHGLATKEFFADKHDDFIMDLEEVDPIAASSWLQPTTVFEGHQHATNGNAGLLQSRHSTIPHTVEQINPNYRSQTSANLGSFDHPPGSTRMAPFDAVRPWSSRQYLPSIHSLKPADNSHHDHWPVRVIIHSVDSERMTLQGTMEAYDVPQHPASLSITNSADRPKAGKKHAPITTYLEGHIIDLSTHSFLTPSAADNKKHGPHRIDVRNATPYTSLSTAIAFPSANAHTDASNWRKLPPFDTQDSDEETARCLLSKARMDEIHQDYIFMRWKEKCFVHTKEDRCSEAERSGDQDRGHGLTISGFYYVSLRRRDGAVEGLYFDPTSTPYQCLRLKGKTSGWPAVELR